MNYQVTCLTPTLVGDGHKLSPIDYMVWKDKVNILDQTRIFKLLSKGPRLEGYLAQLKKATKLDFASWGGFAQNFAGRSIPFEHAAYAAEWNKTSAEYCAIPTFSSGPTGPYLPGASIKGALRTGLLVNAGKDSLLADLPLDAELAAARDVLLSAGIDVRMCVSADPSAEAAAVLVPVVREAVTNILKHSGASYCTLRLTADGAGRLRLLICNDGGDKADSAPLAVQNGTARGPPSTGPPQQA